jgi:hypothetical protein
MAWLGMCRKRRGSPKELRATVAYSRLVRISALSSGRVMPGVGCRRFVGCQRLVLKTLFPRTVHDLTTEVQELN